MYVVYTLIDPRNDTVRYVGITKDVYLRFNQHIRGDCGNIKKNGWIFECRQENVMIIMKALEQISSIETARERERYWIRYYIESGMPIENSAVAKSILKEQRKLDRRARKLQTVEEKKQGKVSRILLDKDSFVRVRQLYQQGITGPRAIERELSIT